MSNYKFIHENKSIELSQDKSLFDLADQVKMRIPTSCGRVGDCHECIVEVSEGLENLSERSEHETFLTEPYRLACQSKIISLEFGKIPIAEAEIICLTLLGLFFINFFSNCKDLTLDSRIFFFFDFVHNPKIFSPARLIITSTSSIQVKSIV